jgi:hypothetical protein
MAAVLAERIHRQAREDETIAPPAPPASAWAPADGPATGEYSGSTITIDFASCYVKEFPGLAWFVMSLGANVHEAADVAQSAFVEALSCPDASHHTDPYCHCHLGRRRLPWCRCCGCCPSGHGSRGPAGHAEPGGPHRNGRRWPAGHAAGVPAGHGERVGAGRKLRALAKRTS